MTQIWIPLNDIPAEGKEITIDEQSIWLEPIAEFKLPYRVVDALSAVLHLLPQEDGCLVRGRIAGSVAMPCDRCAEDAVITVKQKFTELFSMQEDLLDPGQEPAVRPAKDGQWLEIEISALLWEEFVVSMPLKPLCKEECKGLCPQCGTDLNTGSCDCKNEELDPRLAVLQNLKINK
ncbi:MAG: YceD family protein [Halodesulfovibrio sp.]